MKFSLRIRYQTADQVAALVALAEDLGLHGIWVSEPWGYDASAILGWCAARTRRVLLGTHVASVFARTPAATAGMAGALATLSGGRFRLGLGTSGPAVVEGWHGVPFRAPVAHTRDVIIVVRKALRGEPLEHQGPTVKVPLSGHALRFAQAGGPATVPIYLGALGPRNQALTAQEADGWTPTPYSPDHHDALAAALLRAASAAGRTVLVAPVCPVVIAADVHTALEVERRWSAFYLGGMGAFYRQPAAAMGFDAMADEVAAAWSVKDRPAARAALREEYLDAIGLFGPVARIRQRIDRYVAAGIDELVLELRQPDLTDQLDDLRRLAEVIT